jgi:hypothetical protein
MSKHLFPPSFVEHLLRFLLLTQCENKRLYVGGEYSDLTIVSRTKNYQVHKAIVCPRSEYFASASRKVSATVSAYFQSYLKTDQKLISRGDVGYNFEL